MTVTSGVPAGLQERQRTRHRRLAVRSRVPWWAGTALPQSQRAWKRLVMDQSGFQEDGGVTHVADGMKREPDAGQLVFAHQGEVIGPRLPREDVPTDGG